MNRAVKLFFCLVFVAFTYSCNEASKPQQPDLGKDEIADGSSNKEWLIDSLDLRMQYDAVKWFVYSLCFRDTVKWSIKGAGSEKDVYTFGELNIDLDTVTFKNDTVDFKIHYRIAGCGYTEGALGNVDYVLHVGLVMDENKIVYYTTASNFERMVDSTVKNQIAMQLYSVPDYLSQAKKITPWFKDQLVKRGFIFP
jgi:hypothetical protein